MEAKAKKPYEKPQIKQVNLVPEEATLQNCKTPGGSSGQGANACLSGEPGGCKATGS